MKSTRKAYGEFLLDIGQDKDVVVFDADLAEATYTKMFRDKYPMRHIDMGISEQDMVCEACGMALTNKKVFVSSFAMFLCGRAYEQIRNTAAYSNININLCATHTGLAVGEDGATHQMLEDIALMRVIPNMKVFCPCDDISTKKILSQCLKLDGPKYVRLGRNDAEDIYPEDSNFELGKSNTFGTGKNGTIFACGNTVAIALHAKEELKKISIDVRVVDIYSIKPIDKDTIIKCAKETHKLVSIEDHSVLCGLGSAISEVLTDNYPKKLIRLGVKDKFGKSGSIKELYEMYGITKEDIIKEFIKIDR